MRVNRFPRLVVAAAMAGGLVLTGCSKDADPSAEESIGPLMQYLAPLDESQEYTVERVKEVHTQREELAAKCMRELGWDYKPQPWQDMMYPSGGEQSEDAGPEYGTLEYAKQYGYGVVSYPGQDDETTEVEPGSEEEYIDVNEDYVNSLSDSQREAYHADLYGTGQDPEELDEDGNAVEPTYDPSQQGCAGKAYAEQMGEQPYEDPEFKDLIEKMQTEVWGDAENNDQMAEVESEWAACMSGKGYSFPTRGKAEEHIYEQLNAMWETQAAEAGGEAPDEAKLEERQEAIRVEEIKQATDDVTCAEEVKYEKRMTEIDYALQQKFVDENKAQLDAMIAKYGNKKK